MTLFVFIWHVKLGSTTIFALYHHHETHTYLLSNTLWLFLSLPQDVFSIKFTLELVWERVLWGRLIMKWRGTRKTILEVVLPSCLLMIATSFFAKSLLESLIMLFKPQNSSIPLSLIIFHFKLSENIERGWSSLSNKEGSSCAEG